MDGDGVHDHIFGVPGLDSGRGGIAIGYGAASSGLSLIVPISIPPAMLPAELAGSPPELSSLGLGTGLACVGDTDSDGVPDVIITSADNRPYGKGWAIVLKLTANTQDSTNRVRLVGVIAHKIQQIWPSDGLSRGDTSAPLNFTRSVSAFTMQRSDGSVSPWLTIAFQFAGQERVVAREFGYDMQPVVQSNEMVRLPAAAPGVIVAGPWMNSSMSGHVMLSASSVGDLTVFISALPEASFYSMHSRITAADVLQVWVGNPLPSAIVGMGPAIAAAEGWVGADASIMSFLTLASTQSSGVYIIIVNLHPETLRPVSVELIQNLGHTFGDIESIVLSRWVAQPALVRPTWTFFVAQPAATGFAGRLRMISVTASRPLSGNISAPGTALDDPCML